MFLDPALDERYPTLATYSAPIPISDREIVGREHEVTQVLAALSRPVLSNVALLAEAGAGKTSLVQAVRKADIRRDYYEVDLARMISGLTSSDEMAGLVKTLFDEAEEYATQQRRELVLFIDEFHQIVQLSAAAVEALKPVLAASGERGLRIIAATTFSEFHTHIRPNQPLVERLQRINLTPPDRETTVRILAGMAEQYGVEDQFFDNSMFETIHELTERYMPASVQPRKSILVLDSMVGWHRHTGRPMDMKLLAEVLEESAGVNVAFKIDAQKIKDQLDRKVLAQDFATRVVANRLQLCVADLHDKGKPISSFLLAGSTGSGKATTASTEIPVWTEDGSVSWKIAGELAVGDHVFNRLGEPERIDGVFPQGEKEVYTVTLEDGRSLDVSGDHLWAVWSERGGDAVLTTREMLAQGVHVRGRDGHRVPRHSIPANGAVRWPEIPLPLDPYVVGALLSWGAVDDGELSWIGEQATAERIADALQVEDWGTDGEPGWWRFAFTSDAQRVQVDTLLSDQSRIPVDYMRSSIDQRLGLLQGIFDSSGFTIGNRDGVATAGCLIDSEGLASDVRETLFSLGVSSTLENVDRQHLVRVRRSARSLQKLIVDPAELVRLLDDNEPFSGNEDYVGIIRIERTGRTEQMVCIHVEHEEHLYQAGRGFMVTHNTELTKQLSRLLFGDDQRHLVRFDMSEYALDSSVELFRSELTQRVWAMGHCVLLLDEIEKAASTVTRVLLQVLDDGRLSDDNGRQVSFLNCYIVLTTNAGSEIFKTIQQYSPDDDGSGQGMIKRMREIRRSISTTQGDNRFPPELLGRIDAIVPFQPLSLATRRRITANKLRDLRDEVHRKHGVHVGFDPRVLEYLVEDKADSDSDAGGARAALALLTDEVTVPVARFINAHPHERRIFVRIVGTLRSEDKHLLESDAAVEIVPRRTA